VPSWLHHHLWGLEFAIVVLSAAGAVYILLAAIARFIPAFLGAVEEIERRRGR
jgi:hypothetical protein